MVHCLVEAVINCPLEIENNSYFIKYSHRAQKEQYDLDGKAWEAFDLVLSENSQTYQTQNPKMALKTTLWKLHQ